jgi:hypothetical protein
MCGSISLTEPSHLIERKRIEKQQILISNVGIDCFIPQKNIDSGSEFMSILIRKQEKGTFNIRLWLNYDSNQ